MSVPASQDDRPERMPGKRVAVMQPYLFPYIGYFHLMHAVDTFVVLDDVAFIPRGWINRNRILINGAPFLFTVPVRAASQNRPINQTERADDSAWRARFLRTLELAYRRAPQFPRAFDLVTAVLNDTEPNLALWITRSLQLLRAYLSLAVTIQPTSSTYGNSALHGEDRLIDVCLREHAAVYVNAIGGTALYRKEAFAKESIELRFLKPRLVPYRQFGAPFVPGLSILDVLMFVEPDRIVRELFSYDFQ